MDLLVTLHRKSQKYVDRIGLRRVAQRIFRILLRLRYGDSGLARSLQNGRVWLLDPTVGLRGELAEFETIEWIRENVRRGDTVIDVGANVGQMTLEMAEIVGPKGRVFAIEPAPGNLKLLKRHVHANGFSDRVTVLQTACGDTDGQTLTFEIFGTEQDAVGSGHRIAGDESGEDWVRIEVATRTLDSICKENSIIPAAIKIDVEGAELKVVRGGKDVLALHQPAVRIGFHPFAFKSPSEATGDLIRLLDCAGYEIEQPESGEFGLEEINPKLKLKR